MKDIRTFPIKGDLSRKDAEVLIRYSEGKDVFEMGIGGSTILLGVFGKGTLRSVENNDEWIKRTERNIELYVDHLNIKPQIIKTVNNYDDITSHYKGESFIFIDCVSDKRMLCFEKLFPVSPVGTVFMFHDTKKTYVKEVISKAYMKHSNEIGKIENNISGSNMCTLVKCEKNPYHNWNEMEKDDNRVDWFSDDIGNVF